MASNMRVDMRRKVELIDGVPSFVHQEIAATSHGSRQVTREVVGGTSAEARAFLEDNRGRPRLRHIKKHGMERV